MFSSASTDTYRGTNLRLLHSSQETFKQFIRRTHHSYLSRNIFKDESIFFMLVVRVFLFFFDCLTISIKNRCA